VEGPVFITSRLRPARFDERVQPHTMMDNPSPFLLLDWLPFSIWCILLNTYSTILISSSEDLDDFSFPLAPALVLLPPLPGMALAL
jgi:hypothetical protein